MGQWGVKELTALFLDASGVQTEMDFGGVFLSESVCARWFLKTHR